MRYALFRDITQRIVAISDVSGPIGRPETSVSNYDYTPRNISEERRSHAGRSRNNNNNNALDFLRLNFNEKIVSTSSPVERQKFIFGLSD